MTLLRAFSYEENLIRAQFVTSSSIFGCDEHIVFSIAGVGHLGGAKTIPLSLPPAGRGQPATPGQTTSSWLNAMNFMEAWDWIIHNSRFRNYDWVVKADPDAVFFPGRLRDRLRPRTPRPQTEPVYFWNCNRFRGSLELFGALEIFSPMALEVYGRDEGICKQQLQWHGWGEDYFMQYCLEKLNVTHLEDYGMIGDTLCSAAPCVDKTKIAYHPFKKVADWFKCWGESFE